MNDIAVIGAGPGGMAAAVAAARAGARVLVLDEGFRAGGQIWRQPPVGVEPPVDPRLESPSHERGHHAVEAFEAADGVEVRHAVQVFGLDAGSDGAQLHIEDAGRYESVSARRVVLATGAYDRSVAFPGWTLPGVITAGAAQVMVRGFQVQPGRRALVAGTGPLLLPTVTALLDAGVEIVAALEACKRSMALRALPAIAKNRTRRKEAWHYLRALASFRVPYRQGWSVVAALGEERVTGARIAKLDRAGRPIAKTVREIEVDVICTGWGLSPSTELAALVGCEFHCVPVRGGQVPRHDDDQRASVPSVFVAGEIAGVGGADCAVVEGELAGLVAASDCGFAVDAGRVGALRKLRTRERKASDALLGAFTPDRLPALFGLADAETVACRCEDVSVGEVVEAAALFGAEPRAVKMATRAGMGSCQGRICQGLIHDVLRHRCGGAETPPRPAVQMPAKPVSVEALAQAMRASDA